MEDAVADVLVEKLLTFIQDEAHYVCEFRGQFSKLKDELQLMQSFINDANHVKIKDPKNTLKMIIREVRELLYDAEDIIEDCELMFVKIKQQQASQDTMDFSPSFLTFCNETREKLGTLNPEIGWIKGSMNSYLPIFHTFSNQECSIKGSQPVRYPILVNEDEITGLNEDLRKIIDWVLQPFEPLKVIGITGMGGIGKTTLAQKIYINDTVRRHFDHFLIVVVSQTVELKEIIKDMLRKLNVKEKSILRDEIRLFYQLQEQLKGRYLLILDDIWSTEEGGSSWWESLKLALPDRKDGSCVIVTTRNEEIARSMGAFENRIHHTKLLSSEDSWSLFSKIAFAWESGQCPNQELELVGKEIVSHCGGLPLAIKVVGGIMLGTRPFSKWSSVSNRLKTELVIHKKSQELVLSTLRLSYEELPIHLKPCMLSFAAFPEDSEMYVREMIYWWIGEDFVRGRDEMTAYEIGQERQYF